MVGTTLPTPLYPIYQTRFGFGALTITVIFAAYAVGVIGALLLFGSWSDTVGRRPVMLLGLICSALSAALFLVAGGLPSLLISRVLSVISAGIFTGVGTAAVVEAFDEPRRRTGALVAVVANLCGLGAGTLLSGGLATWLPDPLRLPYAIDLALVAAAVVAVLAASESVEHPQWVLPARAALRVPREIRAIFWSAVFAGIAGFALSGVFSAVAPMLLGGLLHIHRPIFAGGLVFVLFGASAAGQGWIPKLPRARIFAYAAAALGCGVAALAAAVALPSLVVFFVSALTGGAGVGLSIGFGLANINERIREERGSVVSTYFTLIYLGLTIPVIGEGVMSRWIGAQPAAYAFCAGTAVVIALSAMIRTRAQRAQ